MSKMEIDLSTLSDDQLKVLEAINPEGVASERQRRQSYDSMEEGLSDLFQKAADLGARFSALRDSPAAKELKASGILPALTRFQNFAKLSGLSFTEPTVPVYVKPALKSNGTAGTAPTTETTAEGAASEGGEQVPAETQAEGTTEGEAASEGRRGRRRGTADAQVETPAEA